MTKEQIVQEIVETEKKLTLLRKKLTTGSLRYTIVQEDYLSKFKDPGQIHLSADNARPGEVRNGVSNLSGGNYIGHGYVLVTWVEA